LSLDAKTIFEVELGLQGRSYFALFLPSPDSPLRWRELLVFAACAYLARRVEEITRVRLEEKTVLSRHSISGIVKKLRGLGLLGNDLRPMEPEEPGRFFNLKKRTPVQRRWTDKLVYTRFYIPVTRARNSGNGLEPHDACLLGFLYFKQPPTTSVAYLAAVTGIDRKQVRTSLDRLAALGFLNHRRGDAGLIISYRYPDQADLFRKAKVSKEPDTAPSLDGVPPYLIQLYEEQHIPLVYVNTFAEHAHRWRYLYPTDWLEIIRECSRKHQSFKAKTGVPYPSPKMLLRELNRLNRSRAQYG
jgi:DNA-binding MarR family transcriptional regulator